MGDVEEIVKLEALFSKNGYDGSYPGFTIEPGVLPILISAPHAVNHWRGCALKPAEVYTGGIARWLNKKWGCHVIYASGFCIEDANNGGRKYQEAIKEYCKRNKIRFVIDLHGAKKNRDYDVEMGTCGDDDPSLGSCKWIADVVTEEVEEWLGVVVKNEVFAAKEHETVTRSLVGVVPCLQLEVNKKWREAERLGEFVGCLERILDRIYNEMVLEELWRKG